MEKYEVVCMSYIMLPGALLSIAVDNGGERNCHFLGFAHLSKFFEFGPRVVNKLLVFVGFSYEKMISEKLQK